MSRNIFGQYIKDYNLIIIIMSHLKYLDLLNDYYIVSIYLSSLHVALNQDISQTFLKNYLTKLYDSKRSY